MPQVARIKLSSADLGKLESICTVIKDIAEKSGVAMKGPIPLPTKRLIVPVRKTPCGDGTATWDHWEMRVHRRLIDVEANDRALKQLMRIQIPDGVSIEIKLKS